MNLDESQVRELVSQARAKNMTPDLSGQNLSGLGLFKYDLHGADLAGATLREIVLDVADLTGADLKQADLTRHTFFARI